MAYKISDACVACGACKEVCPVEAISEGDIYTINADTCIDCGAPERMPLGRHLPELNFRGDSRTA